MFECYSFICILDLRYFNRRFVGLFPVLTDATINVRPLLLSIYENHFVPLGEKLVPGLTGFLSGVLPGLEVGTDYYDR